ncbi:MAG TPA: 23S rRNA (guanosine(2251)-2'-O)-methyltransferase RlmB [Candidatus Dormibacteraeota bacterium]|nr:23S rRNA (guanosine(2251)-2'-O)-methyltransferase RlmB [Candidatus Dormibacteraeota bacterium]
MAPPGRPALRGGGRGRGPQGPPAEELVYGRNAVLEAARAGRLRRAMVARGVTRDPRIEEIASLVSVEEVPPERLDALASGVHQGVVGRLMPRAFLPLRQLLATRPTLLVALDGIEDPRNLGAILRCAEAMGADGAIMPERRSAPITPVAVKASSGATELLPLCRVSGVAAALLEIRKAGIWCVGLDAKGEQPAWGFDLTLPVCLVVGGEGKGLQRLVAERCDALVRLPLSGRVRSLNAAAATAAALYEVVRQRIGGDAQTTL